MVGPAVDFLLFEVLEEAFTTGIAGLIFVSFSAFDYDIPIENPNKDDLFGIKYDYVGLKRLNEEHDNLVNKRVEDLTEEFVETLKCCLANSKMNLWKKIIGVLNSDPIFKENSISELLIEDTDQMISKKDKVDNIVQKAKLIFKDLSSGHKIVLLTLSSLIARVEERTLVVILQERFRNCLLIEMEWRL